jgi:hypothetical protein
VFHYRASVGAVAVVIVSLAGVFLFARPEYRPTVQGEAISGTAFPAPVAGWTWPDGGPGFTFGEDEAHWNFSRVRPSELAPLRTEAGSADVSPASLRVLQAQRLGPGDLSVFAAGREQDGRTCIGVQIPERRARFYCPGAVGSRRLGDQVGIVVGSARPETAPRRFPLFLIGMTRADVVRVVVSSPTFSTVHHRDGRVTTKSVDSQVVYRRGNGWWGAFSDTPGVGYRSKVPREAWRARVDFYGADGLLARLRVRLAGSGDRIYAVTRP